jgi:TonB family protein
VKSVSQGIINGKLLRLTVIGLLTLLTFNATSGRAGTLIRISTNKLLAAATKKPQPQYTPALRAAGAQGQVEVEITVTEDGKVKEARSISGHPLLREPSRQAAVQWEFDPRGLSEMPSDVIGVIVFSFKL